MSEEGAKRFFAELDLSEMRLPRLRLAMTKGEGGRMTGSEGLRWQPVTSLGLDNNSIGR